MPITFTRRFIQREERILQKRTQVLGSCWGQRMLRIQRFVNKVTARIMDRVKPKVQGTQITRLRLFYHELMLQRVRVYGTVHSMSASAAGSTRLPILP